MSQCFSSVRMYIPPESDVSGSPRALWLGVPGNPLMPQFVQHLEKYHQVGKHTVLGGRFRTGVYDRAPVRFSDDFLSVSIPSYTDRAGMKHPAELFEILAVDRPFPAEVAALSRYGITPGVFSSSSQAFDERTVSAGLRWIDEIIIVRIESWIAASPILPSDPVDTERDKLLLSRYAREMAWFKTRAKFVAPPGCSAHIEECIIQERSAFYRLSDKRQETEIRKYEEAYVKAYGPVPATYALLRKGGK